MADDFLKLGMSCPGLLLMRIVRKRFAASETVEAVYNITDLSVVKCKGYDLENFQLTWTEILRAMSEPPSESVLGTSTMTRSRTLKP